LGYRLTGSSDLYENTSRLPFASINFVTAHDGFTLRDLVSYNQKHNQENGENNRDGTDDNRSWNCGEEGPTSDPEILALRDRQVRNFLTTLFLSQGVPMLLGGDEIGRSQQGNNNAYCQDNEISWYDWEDADEDLLEFCRRLIRFRHEHPVFCRRRWFQGRAIHGSEIVDIAWFTPKGTPMSEESWAHGFAKSLGVYLNGRAIPNPNPFGEPVLDDSFYLVLNAHHEGMTFNLPKMLVGDNWQPMLDTSLGWLDKGETRRETVSKKKGGHGAGGSFRGRVLKEGSSLKLKARSLIILKQPWK
jgi:isoamylase